MVAAFANISYVCIYIKQKEGEEKKKKNDTELINEKANGTNTCDPRNIYDSVAIYVYRASLASILVACKNIFCCCSYAYMQLDSSVKQCSNFSLSLIATAILL